MKISLLLPDLRGGGAERVSIDLAQAFAASGHEVTFVLMRAEGEFLEEASQKFPIVDLGMARNRQMPAVLVRAFNQLEIDALIANMWPLTSVAVVARALSRKKPKLLLVQHNTVSAQYAAKRRLHQVALRASVGATYPLADAVAAVSEGAARDLERMAGFAVGAVNVLHNPIPFRPPPDSARREAAERVWGPGEGRRILTVGSLKDSKNHALLLRALAQLGRPAARLMLLGQGQNEAMLRGLAAELGINDRVLFAGFHPDPTPFYASADLFVLSSDHEGLANVLIEALGQGLPVVSTNCPSGPAEILQDGRWGQLVPVGDAGALAEAMDAAIGAAVDRDALKRRAADFSPEIAARRYLDLLGFV